jgi:hypothetical protein
MDDFIVNHAYFKADREMEIMQLELQAMEKKLKDSEEQRNQMKMIVDDFERTMSKMIGTRIHRLIRDSLSRRLQG